MPYTVVRDTREKPGEGWSWRKSVYCDCTITEKLDSGDYSLKGYEHMLAIERKGSIAEWAQNINQERFIRELARLEDITYSFILLEFTMTDIMNYPIGSTIPKYLWKSLKFRGSYVLMKTIEFQMGYKTKIILCGGSGKEVASSIFKRTIGIIENGS